MKAYIQYMQYAYLKQSIQYSFLPPSTLGTNSQYYHGHPFHYFMQATIMEVDKLINLKGNTLEY